MKFASAQEGGQGVPPGIYKAVFEGVTPQPENVEKGYKAGHRFGFKVAEGPHLGATPSRVLGGDRPKRTNGRWNNLGVFLSELTGVPLTAGVEYDVEPCIGKTYTIVVKQGAEGGGTRVEAVMPVQ